MSTGWFLEAVATYVELLLAFYFIQDQDDTTYRNINFLLAIPLTGFILFMNRFHIISYGAMMGYLIYISAAAWFLYGKNWIYKAWLAVIYLFLVTICDFFSMSFIGLLADSPNYVEQILNIEAGLRRYFLLLDKSLLLVFTALIRWYIHRYITHDKYTMLVAFGGTGIVLAYVTCNFSGLHAFLGWTVYIVIGSALALVFCFHIKWTDAERARKELESRIAAYAGYYDSLHRMQGEKERLIHDSRYHYLTMLELLNEKQYQKCGEYLKEISGVLENSIFVPYTANHNIDFIINYKKNEAERQGIEVMVDADTVGETEGLCQSDINIIFGNLLDNAIEACGRMEDGRRWIRIKIARVRQLLVMVTIQNSCGKPPQRLHQELVTQKEQPGCHGLGLKSVERTVKKQKGVYKAGYEDQVFTAEVTLFL